MPKITLGSGDGSRPKTPTLSEYFDAMNGKLPNVSHVSTVFFPGKIPNYSFITDHDFRVNIHKTSPLFCVLLEGLSQWADQRIALSILPSHSTKGAFELVLDDELEVEWERTDWGYKLSGFRPRTATPKVTRK